MPSKILIVDDDPGIRVILETILKRAGYDVIQAKEGVECLKKVAREKPDMVIMDLMMPGDNGWEVCKKIKKDNPSLPVTICSILGSEADIEKSLKYAGADDHITKPFTFDKILHAVRSF